MTAGERAAESLERHRAQLAEEVVRREYERRPEYWGRFGAAGRSRCVDDASFHVRFLLSALLLDTPALFFDYVHWLVELLGSRGIGRDEVLEHLSVLRAALLDMLGDEEAKLAVACLDGALARMRRDA